MAGLIATEGKMVYITFLNGNEYRFINEKRAKIFAEINKTVIFRKTRHFEQKSESIKI